METVCYNIYMSTDEKISEFGINLRKFRKSKGYTQAQLAEISGVSRRAIVHYENHGKKPVFDKVQMLSDALNVSIDDLFGLKVKKSKKKDDDVSYKIMKKVRVIEKLPTRDQNAIFHFINTIVEKNKLKGKL